MPFGELRAVDWQYWCGLWDHYRRYGTLPGCSPVYPDRKENSVEYVRDLMARTNSESSQQQD